MRKPYQESKIRLSSIILYFAALGTGFILIELSLMQKLILLLGNPTTTLAILLFTLLLSSGTGSYISSRLMRDGTKNLAFVIAGITIIGLSYIISLPTMINSVISEPFEIKSIIAVGILLPIGFLM